MHVTSNYAEWNNKKELETLLSNYIQATAGSAATSAAGASDAAASETSKTAKQEDKNAEDKTTEEKESDDNIPLEKTVLDQFTADMLQGCLEVLTEMPGTVFKASDVLSAVALRNGEDWKEATMRRVLEQVSAVLFALLPAMKV